MTAKEQKRNINIIYLFTAANRAWFWAGIWIYYYRSFGGYRAVGILEATMAASNILFEIPTGAIGDLIGKKYSLFIGLILEGISFIWMGYAPSLLSIILSLIFINLGTSLISGTIEATVYDTLKENGNEKKYKAMLNNISTITLISLALCALPSGYLYEIRPGLPFVLTGIVQMAVSLFTLLIKEPKIDTERFSLKSFTKQNLQGFKQLFANPEIKRKVTGFLLVSVATYIVHAVYNDILAVEFGFTPEKMGFMTFLMSIGGAVSIFFLNKWLDKFNNKLLFFITLAIYAVTLLISPLIGLFIGGTTLLIRYTLDPIINNEISDMLNSNIDSKARATSISTYNMFKRIPYMVFIYLVGAQSDVYSPLSIAVFLGIAFMIILIVNVFLQKEYQTEKNKI